MTLAASWESAGGGFPGEIETMFTASPFPEFAQLRPLLIIPEFPVALPGGARPSMTDVFVLAKGACGLVAIAVEGKVGEAFGPLVGEKRTSASAGQLKRLRFLQESLYLHALPDDVRYQLVHRTVSALLAAEMFEAKTALMLVHSFSAEKKWFSDFSRFAEVLGVTVQQDRILQSRIQSPKLFLGWCCGDRKFAQVDLSEATR